jgi:hypothetical protein
MDLAPAASVAREGTRQMRNPCETRDPDRIPVILGQLEQLWERYPDLRLGQLILNALQVDFYHVEDEDFIRRLYDCYDNLEIRLEQ